MSFQSDTVRQINEINKRLDELADAEIDIHRGIASLYLQLPGLIGYWPFSAVDKSSGNIIDQSGNGKTLTESGNSTLNTDGVIPYADLDGAGDDFTRTDESDLDISGTEAFIASALQGITMLGWYQFDTSSNAERMMAKYGSSGNFGYMMRKETTESISITISDDGSSTETLSSSNAVSTTGWYFCVTRLTTSTAMDVFVNGTQTTTTSSIPTSIFNNNASLVLGGDSNNLDGRMSNCALCTTAVPDAIIKNLFNLIKDAYGVD